MEKKTPKIKPNEVNEIIIRFSHDEFDEIYLKTKVPVLAVYDNDNMPIILVKMPDGSVQDFCWNGLRKGIFEFLTHKEDGITFGEMWSDDDRIDYVMTKAEWNQYANHKPEKMWLYEAENWPYPAKFAEFYTENTLKELSEEIKLKKTY